MQTRYLEAEATLVLAERMAMDAGDWESLARLYMPLQEARRQRRQRCGEGTVCLDLFAAAPDDLLNVQRIIERYPQGQLLVAGWGSIDPARRVRELAAEQRLYLETFLGAIYPAGASRMVVIVPLEDRPLPGPSDQPFNPVSRQIPPGCLVLNEQELPQGERQGTFETYGQVMALWERLHAPFLASADAEREPPRKIDGYRQTIRADYACELAHQKLSDVARGLARGLLRGDEGEAELRT